MLIWTCGVSPVTIVIEAWIRISQPQNRSISILNWVEILNWTNEYRSPQTMYQIPHTIGISFFFSLLSRSPHYIWIYYINAHIVRYSTTYWLVHRELKCRYVIATKRETFVKMQNVHRNQKRLPNQNGQPNRIENGKSNWLRAISNSWSHSENFVFLQLFLLCVFNCWFCSVVKMDSITKSNSETNSHMSLKSIAFACFVHSP